MKTKIKEYHIRFNTHSTSNDDRWRLVCDDEEQLFSDIVINAETRTTKDYIEGVGDKYHVTCIGELTIKDNVAYIYGRKKVSINRHLLKTLTWRIVGTIDTMILAWIISGNPMTGLKIGILELFTKMGLYFLHERLWYRVDYGIDGKKYKNKS